MKQNLFLGVVFGVVALTVSCNKLTPQTPGGTVEPTEVPAFNRLMAGVEQHEEEGRSKTILRSPLNVNWVDVDKIKVFDDAGYSLVFGTSQSDVRRAEFFCAGYWTGDAPVMAVHMEQTNISACVPITVGGKKKYKAHIFEVQDIVNSNSYSKTASISMGRVTLSGDEYEIETMFNMFSLVQFDVKSPNIKSVTLEAENNATGVAVPLAGWVELNYNEGNPTCLPNSPVSTTVTVRPKGTAALEGGTFKPANHYLFSVIPQTPAAGLTVYLTLENADGKRIRRTLRQNAEGEVIKFVRNRRHPISTPLDHGVTGYYDPLVLDVDFSSDWPFSPDCATKAHQLENVSGISYSFGYTDTDAASKTCEFVLGNPDDNESFYRTNGAGPDGAITCLRFENKVNGSWIKLPAIEGRQLRTIELTCCNNAAKAFYLNTTPSTSSIYPARSFGGSGYVNPTNSYTHGSLDYDTSYYVLFNGPSVQLTHMTLTYEKF